MKIQEVIFYVKSDSNIIIKNGGNMRALRLNTVIDKKGKLILDKLPFKKGAKVEVIILGEDKELFQDIMKASESSLKFWDNEIDDRVWNNV